MMKTRRQALALLGSSTLSACATSPGIVTRDKNDPFEGGIGGTGIVGTLNGFGSLLINGLTVELQQNTRVRTPFGLASADVLAPGHVLTVVAERRADTTVARSVSLDYALVGQLQRHGSFASVNGVRLIGLDSAIGDGNDGSRVAVSGIWTPSGVRPSRIDAAPHTFDLIAGTFDAGGIGGLPLVVSDSLPNAGTYAVALGQNGSEAFAVENLLRGRFASSDVLEQLSVEGYLEPTRQGPGFRVAGLGHSFARRVQLSQVGQSRVIFFGPYDGLFEANRGYVVPDRFAARQSLLRGGLAQRSDIDLIRL